MYFHVYFWTAYLWKRRGSCLGENDDDIDEEKDDFQSHYDADFEVGAKLTCRN